MDTSRTLDRSSAAAAALLLIQVCIGYEWFVSGLSKLVHGDFPSGLAAELRDMSGAAPGWYRGFLDGVVIPHAVAFGYAIEIAELAVGVVLLVTVLRLPARISRYVPLATSAALVGGIVLAVNFALASGSSFGLSLAHDSFDEGIDLDTVLVGLQLALLVFAVAAARLERKVDRGHSARGLDRLHEEAERVHGVEVGSRAVAVGAERVNAGNSGMARGLHLGRDVLE